MACGCAGFSALEKDQQLLLSGFTNRAVKEGPGWAYIPCCNISEKRKGIVLSKLQYAIKKDTTTGEQKVLLGPGLFFLGPYEEILEQKPGSELGTTDYLKIVNQNNGELKLVQGPGLWRPEDPYDKIDQTRTAIPLNHHEYVKIIDNNTGGIRVVKGENLVYLTPTEEVLDIQGDKGVKRAINIDEHTAIWIRNTKTGQLRLHTRKELFFPGPHETVERVLQKIVLEDHQVVILKDKQGRYIFKEGRAVKEGLFHTQKDVGKENVVEDEATDEDEERSFFLPPYTELEEVGWYTSEDMLQKPQRVTHFDLRPQFLTYQFVARTCDNVELIIDLTFFWEIINIRKMIHKTDILPDDICHHARSVIIQRVSQVTLEEFMGNFNDIIAKAVLAKGDTFYDERGAFVHSVEVRSIHCKDAATEQVLQEIIKETTDRLNRLQKQASDNEVRLSKMKGDIEEEKLNGTLLGIRHDHHRAEALMEGEAEADQINAFLKGISNVPFEHQMTMWSTLRKLDGIYTLAEGNSQMYFTPNDINLSIETLHAPGGPRKVRAAPRP